MRQTHFFFLGGGGVYCRTICPVKHRPSSTGHREQWWALAVCVVVWNWRLGLLRSYLHIVGDTSDQQFHHLSSVLNSPRKRGHVMPSAAIASTTSHYFVSTQNRLFTYKGLESSILMYLFIYWTFYDPQKIIHINKNYYKLHDKSKT